jgi:hypothetical protein
VAPWFSVGFDGARAVSFGRHFSFKLRIRQAFPGWHGRLLRPPARFAKGELPAFWPLPQAQASLKFGCRTVSWACSEGFRSAATQNTGKIPIQKKLYADDSFGCRFPPW